MKIGNWFRALAVKDVALDMGNIKQYTLFECKYLFSIIFYKWENVQQSRFHTHAFASMAILLKGSYEEDVLVDDKEIVTRTVDERFKLRHLPKDYCHCINKAKPGTWTVVFCGPWKKTWEEYFVDTNTWIKYTWGRKRVYK
jgi:hypothetical protein